MAQGMKNIPAMQETQETWVQYLGCEDPLEMEWQPIPVLLAENSHGQKSLEGSSPRGYKESDKTEHKYNVDDDPFCFRSHTFIFHISKYVSVW